MNKRTILFVLNIGFDRHGPCVHLFNDIFKTFLESNYSVVVIQRVQKLTNNSLAMVDESLIQNNDIRFITIADKHINSTSFVKRYFAEYLYSLKLKNVYKKIQNIDAVFIESTFTLKSYSKNIKKILKCPILYNCQDIFPENASTMGLIKNRGFLYKMFSHSQLKGYENVDKIITISKKMKDTLMNFGVAEEKISFVYNWGTYKKERKDYCDELGKLINFDSEKFNVLYAGNIGYAQNVEIILDVAKKVKNPNIVFYIVGNGSLKEKITDEVTSNKVNNVRIFNAVPQKYSIDLYKKADVNFVCLKPGIINTAMPSKIPNIVASGKPVIFTSDSISDLNDIFENVEGIHFVKSNCDDIAELIDGLSKARKKYNFMPIYDSFFSMKNTVHYVNIINKLIDHGK